MYVSGGNLYLPFLKNLYCNLLGTDFMLMSMLSAHESNFFYDVTSFVDLCWWKKIGTLTKSWPWVIPHLNLLCVSQHRQLNAIGQKKVPSHSLAITIERLNGDRVTAHVRSTCSIWSMETMNRTLVQHLQVKLSFPPVFFWNPSFSCALGSTEH